MVVQGVASARGTGNVQEQIQELSRQHAEAMAAIANLSREPTRSYFYVPGERHIQPFSGDLGKDNRNVVRMTVTFLSTGRGPSSGALRVPIDQRKRRACLAPRAHAFRGQVAKSVIASLLWRSVYSCQSVQKSPQNCPFPKIMTSRVAVESGTNPRTRHLTGIGPAPRRGRFSRPKPASDT